MAVYTTIDNPELYFQTKLYTGQASSQGDGTTTAITFDGDENMQPDLIWIKNRDGTDWNDITDSVRGVAKSLFTNTNDDEEAATTSVTAIGSDGFTVGSSDQVNDASDKYVAWGWKESATAGFDIVSWSGTGSAQNVSHSLSAVPKMIIVKNRSAVVDWYVYNVNHGNTHSIIVNSTNGKVGPYSDNWNDTTPTSSVFTVGSSQSTGGSSGNNMIAYVFTDIQGYSKVSGTYVGNGNADGPFVYCGFRPAWVMWKGSSANGNHWHIHDNKRSAYNGQHGVLKANAANAEYTGDAAEGIEMFSNGWKPTGTTNSNNNHSGVTYIWMAFAEAPFVNSNGVPCNAR